MKSSVVFRARVLSGAFILIGLLLVTRLYFVQIVHGSAYQKDAMGQYIEQSPESNARGTIFFTAKNGELVSAAVTQTGWRIAINPEVVTDPQSVYDTLNAITPIDREKFFASANKKTDPYEEIAFRLDDATADKVRAKQITGVMLVQDQWRYYPGNILASQTLGFVGYKGNTKEGIYGLESEYQTTLAQSNSGLFVNPFAEIFTNVQEVLATDPAEHQGSVITSIDPQVQSQLETTLDDVMKTYSPKLAGGIIMDPHTGEIYAIASRPTYDPNNYNLVTNPADFGNPLVEGRFELGSIMKPLTMAAGIDSGAITQDTTYNDTGCLLVSTYKVCNYDLKARGVIPMQQILSQSLNVGASFVATKTGYPTFTRYIQAYGFGEKTGVDLPDEVTGDLSPLGTGTGPAVNYDTASFGQGISESPIEMIRALSTLANEGVLPSPHVVTAIKYDNGITRSIAVPTGPRVLKASTADAVTNMLTVVFDKALLNGALKQDHYTFAAKTGTAQIAMPGGGYYPGDTYIHSFFGYFPAHDPRFIIFLFAYEPHGQEYASATLARPFMGIAQFMINYYNIPPDR